MANGISFREKLPDDFQLPALSRYLRSMEAFSISTFLPFMTASFAQIAQDTCPARNFSTGLLILLQLRETSSNVTVLSLDGGERIALSHLNGDLTRRQQYSDLLLGAG